MNNNSLINEETLRAIFNNAVDGMIVINNRGIIQSVNNSITNMFQFSNEEMIGNNISMLMPEPDHSKHDGYLKKHHETGEKKIIGIGREVVGKRTDNTTFPFFLSICDVEMQNGEKLFAGVIHDISVLKKAQNDLEDYSKILEKNNSDLEKHVSERTAQLSSANIELESSNVLLAKQIDENKKANIELLKSQQMLSIIAQNYPNGIISVYNKSHICEFIEGLELKKLGLSKEDFLGKTIAETFDKEISDIHTYHFNKTVNGESTMYELVINNNNYLFYTTPIKDNYDSIDRIVVVCLNISLVKEAEEKTRHALDKANELSELKSRFISMASHEFRTPLSTILSSLNLMVKYKELNEHVKFASHGVKIKTSIINLTEILEYFLSVEKLDSGHFKIEPTTFDLVDFINTNIDEVVNDLKDKQRIVLQLSLKKIMINHDKKIIRTIWQNLITNAIKYSPENGEIIVHLQANDDRFILSVIDNGIGIPLNEQKHLFERFYRANNAANIQGTGIGLNIIKKYIELLGGNITFTSKLNVGTTFTINLPLVLNPISN
jgi:PAS domain S-box-containing protein